MFFEILNQYFADWANIILPLRHMILQPITFGLVAPDKTANIMRSSANFKPVMQAKLFSSFNIIQMHYQNQY